MENNEFGYIIHQLRSKRNLSLRKLAEISGIEFSRLSRIEKGDRPPPNASGIIELAKALKCPLAMLYQSAGIPLLPGVDTPENILSGTIIKNDNGLALIECNGFTFQGATPLNKGTVKLSLRARDITLFSNKKTLSSTEGSARNHIKGKVTNIIPSPPFTMVEFNSENITFQALITTQSAENLEIEINSDITGIFKVASLFIEPLYEIY